MITPETKKVFKLLVTAALGASIIQINTGIDTWLATFLENGSVSYLYYGNRLIQFPLAFFTISLVVVYFPILSRTASQQDIENLKKTSKEGLDLIMFLTFPSMITLIILSPQIIDVIFKHGMFDQNDLVSTSLVILCYSLGIWSIAGTKLYVRIFHSLQDMMTPVKIGIYSAGLNFVLNVILMQFLSYAGLALSTTLSATFQLFLLSRQIDNKVGKIKGNFFDLKYFKFLLASTIIAFLFYYLKNGFYHFNDPLLMKTFHLSWIICAGWLLYFFISYLSGCEEPKYILKLISRRTD